MKKIFIEKGKLILLLLLFFPLFVFAIESGDDVIEVLKNITNWLWRVFVVATVIAFLFAGFFYFTAAGNPEKINKAHRMVLYGIIGVAVALLAGGMEELVKSFLEVQT